MRIRRRGSKAWWSAVLHRIVEAEYESRLHPVTGQLAWTDGYTVARGILGRLAFADPYARAIERFRQLKRRPPAIYVYDIRLHPQRPPQPVVAVAEKKKRAAGAA